MPTDPAQEIRNSLESLGIDGRIALTLSKLAEESLNAEISSGTAISSLAEATRVHVIDSLSVFSTDWLDEARDLIDVGSGLGFPGLVIAAVRPDIEVSLLDAARKKAEAAALIAKRADVPNIRSLWGRAEELGITDSPHHAAFDVVTARALAPLPVLAEYAAPLLRDGGALIAWKAKPEPSEVSSFELACDTLGLEAEPPKDVHPFANSGDRTLWRAVKVRPTPSDYPRRTGVAARSPLGAD